MAEKVTVRLLIRFDALPGRESEVESFLDSGLPMVQEEPKTTAWFGIRLRPSTFGIFDAFPDDSGRQAHVTGRVAAALMDNAGEVFEEASRTRRWPRPLQPRFDPHVNPSKGDW